MPSPYVVDNGIGLGNTGSVASLTTNALQKGDVVQIAADANNVAVVTSASSPGLGAFTLVGQGYSLTVWQAQATSNLGAQTITLNFGSAYNTFAAMYITVRGAVLGSPNDPNTLPVTTIETGNPAPVPVVFSTAKADDLIIFWIGCFVGFAGTQPWGDPLIYGNTIGPGSWGWINGLNNTELLDPIALTAYTQTVSTTQSGVSVSSSAADLQGAAYLVTALTGTVTPPGVPVGEGCGFSSPVAITPSWAEGSGDPTTSYTLQWRQVGTSTWNVVTGITATSYSISGLSPGTQYEWQVEAINSGGSSGFSSSTVCSTAGIIVQPIKVTPECVQFALNAEAAIMGHLYSFTSATGSVEYFTDMDLDIVYNGITWKSGSLRFDGLHRKLSVGLNVDEQDLKIWASPTDTLWGANFLTGAEEGLLDGAVIVRYRIVWKYVTGNVAVDVTYPPVCIWILFTGYTAAISKIGTSHIELKVKSPLHKLEVNMPRNYYQPGCLWTLFDQGCTLVKSSFAVTGTIGSGPTLILIPVSGGISSPVGADGIATYAQGRLLFTSGVNSGLQVLINANDASNLGLAYPLNALPSAGDGITYYPGCSKSFNTCDLKFANTINFRGFDKVPPIMLSV